jgi:hypothetical protein
MGWRNVGWAATGRCDALGRELAASDDSLAVERSGKGGQ